MLTTIKYALNDAYITRLQADVIPCMYFVLLHVYWTNE